MFWNSKFCPLILHSLEFESSFVVQHSLSNFEAHYCYYKCFFFFSFCFPLENGLPDTRIFVRGDYLFHETLKK